MGKNRKFGIERYWYAENKSVDEQIEGTNCIKKIGNLLSSLFRTRYGNRTRVLSVKGTRPNP